MNKTQLAAWIAEKEGISQAHAEKFLEVTLDGVTEALINGQTVSLVGFGSFGVKTRSKREVRNPRTGDKMTVEATVVPFFKAGKNLKESVDTLNH